MYPRRGIIIALDVKRRCKEALSFFLIAFSFSLRAEEGVRFCAVGDVLLDRGLKKVLENNSPGYIFEETSDFIKSHDLALCNLECVISTKGIPIPKQYTFRADTSVLNGLKASGFNIYSLANNHTIDFGRDALIEMKELLEENNFYTVGAGENQTEALKPLIVRIKDISIAIFANLNFPLESYVYLEDLAGPCQASIEELTEEIKEIKEKVDFIIVSFHWGREFDPYPTNIQIENAHKTIEAGADLIIGHHPHVIQSIEKYNDKFIIYSLGNFVFDQQKTERRETFIFSCEFSKTGIKRCCLIPVTIEKYDYEKKCGYRPVFPSGEISNSIFRKVETLSKNQGANFYIENDKIYIK